MSEKLYDVDEFWKFNLRVGHITKAERVPNTNKLIRLEVDFGAEKRVIVAGIGDQYEPSDLDGLKTVFILNLKPKKIRGVVSEGMLIVAEDEASGKVYLLRVPDDAPIGAKVW